MWTAPGCAERRPNGHLATQAGGCVSRGRASTDSLVDVARSKRLPKSTNAEQGSVGKGAQNDSATPGRGAVSGSHVLSQKLMCGICTSSEEAARQASRARRRRKDHPFDDPQRHLFFTSWRLVLFRPLVGRKPAKTYIGVQSISSMIPSQSSSSMLKQRSGSPGLTSPFVSSQSSGGAKPSPSPSIPLVG